jgi:hypothetical protein
VTALTQLVGLLEGLDREGTTVIALARDGRPAEPWTIYPDEEGVFDRRTRCQFYFHAHPGVTHEAGHIHTVRLFPDHTVHLVAISLGHDGWPRRLTTLNLWAVGDRWAPPLRLRRWVREFGVTSARVDPRLVRFVNLVFLAFREEIERLQEEKAACLDAWRAAHPGADPFEDRSLEVLSVTGIDLRAPISPAA